MRFIKSFQKRGTLLFVRHDMSAVKDLCQYSIWLEKGTINAMGASRDVTNAYLQSILQSVYRDERRLNSIAPDDTLFGASDAGNSLNLASLDYQAEMIVQDIFGENTLPFTEISPTPISAKQTFKAEFDFILPMLQNGEYVVMASVTDGNLYDNAQHHLLHDAMAITVSSRKVRWGLAGILFDRVSMEIIDE